MQFPVGSVARRIELRFRVRFDECGADGHLRDSGILRYAQEVAWVHSEDAGFDRRWYRRRRLTWLVRAVELEVLGHVEHGESVIVSTEVTGWRRVWARRSTELRGTAGELRARARIDWVLLGPAGRPSRIPGEIADFFTTADIGTFRPVRLDLGPAPSDAASVRFRVRRRDLDPIAHVNNAVYLDYADEALAAAGGTEELRAQPRYWTVEFVRPAGPDESMTSTVWRDGHGWAYRLCGPSGDESIRARLKTAS